MNIEDQKQKICTYCNNIFNNRSAIEEFYMKELFGTKLTLNEVHILEQLDLNVYQNMSELAEALFITPGTLSTSIKKLTQKEHVIRTQDTMDKRVFSIELTPKGLEAVELHRKIHDSLILDLWRDDTIDNDKLVEVLSAMDQFFIQAAKKHLKK